MVTNWSVIIIIMAYDQIRIEFHKQKKFEKKSYMLISDDIEFLNLLTK